MSTSAPWTLRNECHCGHHKDSHFEGKHSCLGMYCDCARFRKPKPAVQAAESDGEAPTDP